MKVSLWAQNPQKPWPSSAPFPILLTKSANFSINQKPSSPTHLKPVYTTRTETTYKWPQYYWPSTKTISFPKTSNDLRGWVFMRNRSFRIDLFGWLRSSWILVGCWGWFRSRGQRCFAPNRKLGPLYRLERVRSWWRMGTTWCLWLFQSFFLGWCRKN